MITFGQNKPLKSTSFSDFFRNASSREKKKVYSRVLKRATARQQAILDQAKAKIEQRQNSPE
ncbi:hypothetical protein QWI17_02820 [Gilvimarinus sp. SDUM040013]|uniref:Uncharacterized protein n=1 Tax=Gilvimarinus gilvus TaxID=3058038 RepID=A0ABU4S1P5_9GAMM|nr:hypothetical protein [Gilvimarinus sp. SDUM040013]MDO3384766.1 hypothetical protein [Gilvimarinus sp. SDUM040013]MDX6850416.1 hypothetical protein [Gilvimarinus sp. SDUM040013]